MKCSNCGNFLPPNSPLCPFCGTKIEQKEDSQEIKEPDKNQNNLEKSEIDKNIFSISSIKWLEFSLNFIINNIRDIILLGIINNPLFFILSLGIVSLFYNSYLYQFCLAFKKSQSKIIFDYKKNFSIGFKITYLNFIVFLPFLFLSIIPLIFFILTVNNFSNNFNFSSFLILILLIFLYLIMMISFSILPIIFILTRNFVILELIDYEEGKWNFLNIVKKTYKTMLKKWLTFIIIFALALVVYYSLYNAFTILCYCTVGLLLFFISIPYIMIDILILGYMMNEKMKKEGLVTENV